jgi:hypothetical protein
MLQPLDGPSKQYKLSAVDTITAVRIVKPTENELEERKVVTIQPIDSSIRVYFGDGSTVPSAATIAADGFLHYKKAKESYEASASQEIYILAEAGTTVVIIAERA